MSDPAPASCRNCAAALTGPYCSQCGQRDIDYQQSIGTVFRDFLDSFLAFDGKVIQTLWLLLSRPGELTVRFLQGQQIRFLNPIRVYVSVSLVFFLVLHFAKPTSTVLVLKGDSPAGHLENAAPIAQQRVYGQSWGTTAMNFLGLYIAYAVVLIVAVTVTGTLAFYLIAST